MEELESGKTYIFQHSQQKKTQNKKNIPNCLKLNKL